MSMCAALDSKEVDAIVTPNLSLTFDYIPVINIGFSDYYFAVSKSRPDLLKELNEALYGIQNTELDYNNLLVSRYQNVMSNSLMLNEKEEAWLSEHGNKLKIGYLDDNLLYSIQGEDGEMQGVMKTLAETLEQEFGISVETKSYNTSMELDSALKQGEVDSIGPVYSDFYLAEQQNYVLTNSFLSTTPVILFKNTDSNTYCNVIAATNESLFSENVIRVLYPDAQLYLCDGIRECLDAVVSGKADSTLVTSMRLNVLRQYRAMEELQFADTGARAEICLATTKENRVAAAILNRGITIASDRLNGVVLAENSYVQKSVTFRDFVKDHMIEAFWGAVVIILLLGVMSYRLFVNSKKLAAALEEAKKEKENAYNLNLCNSELKVKANQDALTGIGNRYFFFEKMTELLAANENLILCYCDLDHLKYINDEYGHTEGDNYIRQFVQIVKSHIRSEDIFARIGGDEFCIVLRGCKYEIAVKKIEQMQILFSNDHSKEYRKSFSCGIIEIAEHHDSVQVKEILKQVDDLMYEQKMEHKKENSIN